MNTEQTNNCWHIGRYKWERGEVTGEILKRTVYISIYPEGFGYNTDVFKLPVEMLWHEWGFCKIVLIRIKFIMKFFSNFVRCTFIFYLGSSVNFVDWYWYEFVNRIKELRIIYRILNIYYFSILILIIYKSAHNVFWFGKLNKKQYEK